MSSLCAGILLAFKISREVAEPRGAGDVILEAEAEESTLKKMFKTFSSHELSFCISVMLDIPCFFCHTWEYTLNPY